MTLRIYQISAAFIAAFLILYKMYSIFVFNLKIDGKTLEFMHKIVIFV